jgi:hypothetical protein
MSRIGCPEEESPQSTHSPSLISNDEPVIFVLVLRSEDDERSHNILRNGRLKDKNQSLCRPHHCTFAEMRDAVVKPQINSGEPVVYKGYLWATAGEIRSIIAERNKTRDKSPGLTPENVGAFCVIDDGTEDYRAHARTGYADPIKSFWTLHETVAARLALVEALWQRGKFTGSAEPPFVSATPSASPGRA